MSASPPGWSADSNWFWDGLQWNDAVSPDGKWRFDGREWKAFHGQRSLMPTEPLHPAVPEPLAPAAAANLPSWVAQSEVERLEQERLERERLAAQAALPQVPLPPEQDWRRVGEHMQFSRSGGRVESFWQVGCASMVIFLVVYLFCPPAALVFIWLTAWKTDSKVIVTVLVLLPSVILAFMIMSGTLRLPS